MDNLADKYIYMNMVDLPEKHPRITFIKLTFISVDAENNNKETELYSTAGVFTVGYKFEF